MPKGPQGQKRKGDVIGNAVLVMKIATGEEPETGRNPHSKKLENHVHMVALYTTWYNFARINSAVRMSPAMAAGLTERLWDVSDIVKLIEDWEAATNEMAA
jgi:hypothetical protein